MSLYKRILIAVDNSQHSNAVAEYGITLASHSTADCALVCVINTKKINDNKYEENFPLEVLTKLRDDALITLNTITDMYPDINIETFMPEDKPSQGILKTAENWKADLIVIGTRGNSGIKRLLLGSTAENTIRHSAIPVLVIPPSE